MAPSGGAGTVLGVNYQARVVAWLAARALAGQAASAQLGWLPRSEIQSIWVETTDAVDDIRVSTARDGSAYLQAKHAVDASSRDGSPLAKALHQFAAQELDENDRLVLITSSSSSSAITRDLPRVLDRIRILGSIDSEIVCRTQAETRVYAVVTEHLRREWAMEERRVEDAAKIKRLLSRVYVAVVDVEYSQPAAIEADQLLRGLLLNPGRSGEAWAQLIDLANQVAILQAGMTPASVARHLSYLGIQLGPQLDYRPDIDRLRGFSLKVIERLNLYRSVIGDHRTPVRLDRDFADDLQAAAEESLLITGDPGAGKSGALAELIERLPFADVVAFSADSLANLTNGELRSEIGLDHGLSEVLANWRSERPGYLVIDALDAGRGPRPQQALLELIASVAQTSGRWKVVATVRRFDLRYSPTLKELFPAGDSEVAESYKLAEFSRVRHFNIAGLTPGELAQLDHSAPHLSEMVRHAAPTLRDLLSSPFSLRLFAELVSYNGSADQIHLVTSRLQLLASYWDQRVLDSPNRSRVRENLLLRIGEEMIARGVLTVDSALFEESSDAADLAHLLHVGLLVEELTGPFGSTRLLAFAHHVLFDYAVARLILSGRDIRAEAISNPASLFLVRPSYQMYFEGVWQTRPDRQDFWSLAMSITAFPDVPEIAKVIAPAVAAALIERDQDLAPLSVALDVETQGSAGVLQHLVNALLTDEAGHSISPDHLLVWAAFVESVSRRLDIARAVVVRNFIREFTALVGSHEPNVTAAIGLASRRLLRWTWADDKVDRFFTHVSIAGVTSTFAADAVDTTELVRAIIAPDHLARYGYIEMPSLADTILSLLSNDPVLVRDIYMAAFEYEEQSTDATPITRGILNMSSNRRQDFEHSHYTLAQHFPVFLDTSPREAISALCSVYEKYASRYGYRNHIEEVSWAGETMSFVDDYLFESGHRSSDDEEQMLDAFIAWMRRAEQGIAQQAGRLDLATETLRTHVAPAALWRALLRSIPNTVDLQFVAPLLQSPSALASHGLTRAIGEVLHTRFAGLNSEQRLEIEDAIMHLDTVDGRTSHVRTRLNALLPEPSLQTEAAQILWRESHGSDDNISEARELSVEPENTDFGLADELHAFGIDPDAAANATLLRDAQPVKEFNGRHLNEVPTSDSVRETWPRITALWSRLRDLGERRDASTTLVVWSFRDLAQAIDVVARSEVRVAMSQDQIRELVGIAASLMRERTDEPEDLDDFDAGSLRSFELPIWVVQASVALILQGHDDGRLEGTIRAAAVDRSPSVRFCVAGRIKRLRDMRPDLVNTILATMEAREESGGVLSQLAHTLAFVDWERPDRLVERLRQFHTRAVDLGARGERARESCSELAAALFIWRGTESAEAFLDDLLGRFSSTAADLKGAASQFRSAFAVFGPDRDMCRERAFTLAVRIVSLASSRFAEVRASSVDESGAGEQHAFLVKDLAHLIETVSNDVYFSSGAHDREGDDSDPEPRPPVADYYLSARALLLALPEVPFPSVIHHVLETLDFLSPADPAQVFRDMTNVIVRGRAGGYEYDQMAASFVTGSVSRFLVQNRHLLQTDPDLRNCLIQVLDTFVAVGWGEARILTYQLDTVFR